jgi:hypothetical protein
MGQIGSGHRAAFVFGQDTEGLQGEIGAAAERDVHRCSVNN